jgi:subtilisin family serine protease
MAWSKALVVFVIGIIPVTGWTQANRYIVFFKDKPAGTYTLNKPLEYLSPRAVDRRNKQGISVTSQDFPVNETYIASIRATGASVFFRSRWMNAVLIQCNESLLPTLRSIPHVDRVEYVAPGTPLANGRKKFSLRTKSSGAGDVTDTQLGMVGIDKMHTEGYHGEDMVIGIFDGGFPGVNVAAPFQDIITENRIMLTQDFIRNTDDVFQYDSHGTEVFSVIAARQQNVFTGGAYKARYQLYVTEDVSTEYRIEEYNWLFAAEKADSAGVDIINSSLGYNTFDDESMDYEKTALDGKTAVVTRAAQWLADRGVLVVCSAGNEGSNSWQLITPPADAKDVLAVASVTDTGVRLFSSSKGPVNSKTIKPDVAAMGGNTAVILPGGSVGAASGTSLASPIIASLAAGIWQHYPLLRNKDVMDIIRKSSSQSGRPDNLMGYGIPSYAIATRIVSEWAANPLSVYPNPIILDTLYIRPFVEARVTHCLVEVISEKGQILFTRDIDFTQQNSDGAIDFSAQSAGLYVVRIHWNDQVSVYSIVKK